MQSSPLYQGSFDRSGNDFLSRTFGSLSRTLFREYDLRGRVRPDTSTDGDLDEFVAYRIALAFGTFLDRVGMRDVVVGFDARSYSFRLASAFQTGLLATGRNVISIGLATTPMVYFGQHYYGGVAGCAVTASHNPNGWSGLKLGHAPSKTLGPEEVGELRAIADSGTFTAGSGLLREENVLPAYSDFLASKRAPARPLRVVIDGANGIAAPVAAEVLRRAGHTVIEINRTLDWTFPAHEPDPESLAARLQIAEAVRAHHVDIGLSFDGDGDRLGVTDERGEIVWSDLVLAILARDVLARRKGMPIVYDVKCSRAVGEVIREAGGEPVMWKTGHSHIKRKMQELGAPFAGERSGHFFDNLDYYGFDDGIYAGLSLLTVLSAGHESLSTVVGGLPAYRISPTMHAQCDDERKYKAVEEFTEYAAGVGATELITVNGVRAEFPDGWLLVRASSNLPSLVIVIEAETDERLLALYELTRKGLSQIEGVSSEWENDPFHPS